MFRKLFTLISLITAGIISYLFIDSWQEFWIFPVVLIGTYITCIAVFAISLYLLTFYIKDDTIYDKPSKFYHYFLAYALEFVCCGLCRIKIKTIGMEKIPKDQKFLIVQNHRSNLDPMVNYPAFKKFNISFISKPENFKLFVVGKFITRTGNIPLNRENNREGIKAILRAVDLIKSDKFSVMVCPEGTRNRYNKNLLPFKGGTFKIAQKANVPVVISSIDGTEQVTKRAPWRSTKVTITIIDVINPKDYDSTNAMAEYAQKIISETLGVKVHTEEELEMLKNGTYNANANLLNSKEKTNNDTQSESLQSEEIMQENNKTNSDGDIAVREIENKKETQSTTYIDSEN